MKTPLHYHRYTLRSSGALNAVSTRREFQGALIKLDGGVGCLHPWPEFGDLPVGEQLGLLQAGGTSKVIERALRMARMDGEARSRNVSLFDGLEIPPCHYSWDQNADFERQCGRVVTEGWRAVKTKGHADPALSFAWITRFTNAVPDASVRVRMDFNSCLTEAQFTGFLRPLPDHVKARLDFAEDPFPYDPVRWDHVRGTHRVQLALDKQLRGASEGFDVAVLKPGRREWREMVDGLPPSTRIVMTSAMDHAIGQSFAAWEAAVAWQELGSRLDLCGLCTEHLFEQDAFFARLRSVGGQLHVNRSGTGLGFNEELNALPWQPMEIEDRAS